MSNHDELVKALRHCVSDEKGVTKCAGCPYYPDITGCMDRLHTDAAAAIEELQAQLPKRGEIVRCRECKHYSAGFECLAEGYGIERGPDWFCADGEREVQE